MKISINLGIDRLLNLFKSGVLLVHSVYFLILISGFQIVHFNLYFKLLIYSWKKIIASIPT